MKINSADGSGVYYAVEFTENDVDDLIGYLILLKIAIDKNTYKEV